MRATGRGIWRVGVAWLFFAACAEAPAPEVRLVEATTSTADSLITIDARLPSVIDTEEDLQQMERVLGEVTARLFGNRPQPALAARDLGEMPHGTQAVLIRSLAAWLRSQEAVSDVHLPLHSAGDFSAMAILPSYPAQMKVGLDLRSSDGSTQPYSLTLSLGSRDIRFVGMAKVGEPKRGDSP